MAGIPGLFVVLVFSGAMVMTVTGPSPEPPVPPETTPQPAARDAHATRAPVDSMVALMLRGRRGVVVLRLPVMSMHDSATFQMPV
ncbi:hypothetical protein GCM10010094_37080 [Streptomyces flaveus]|uniref:Uncharacterized protein n=1 Tax=Streptomyces flaveus TaxID=66370 RepID=A0A917VFH4_9ACTN|nr:hypothetical protein GCM10010094_37080 [Streptomyces flaveus]